MKPAGWSRRHDLLTYSPMWVVYETKPTPENGYEAVALYTQDQMDAAVADGDRWRLQAVIWQTECERLKGK